MVAKIYFILMGERKGNQLKKNELKTKIIKIISTHIIFDQPLLIKNA